METLEKLYPDCKKTVFRVSRENDQKSRGKGEFKGALHTVGVKVDRPIWLMGAEFFGPAKATSANYRVRVLINRTEEDWSGFGPFRLFGECCGLGPYYKVIDLLPEYTDRVYNCKKGENFSVIFPEPVRICPNLWTDIKFELGGPTTECLQFGYGGGETVSVEGSSVVRFEFLGSSRQLAGIHFTTH